jgi:NADH:ubiquinone reductase (H+-translocating)
MSDGRVHRVVIVGGGFAGLRAAKSLRSPAVQVTLLDRRNHHVFQPLLYQVATGLLSPANIATPLRSVFRRQRNVEVLLEEVVDFDLVGKVVRCRGRDFPYDTLVLAAGVRHHYFGRDDWETVAPGLKSLEDATTLRRRILYAFEAAELEDDPEAREGCLTFVVVGAGPTGVEMAGAIGELARSILPREFRRISAARPRILLLEGGKDILSSFAAELSGAAMDSLARLGVMVRTDCVVTEVRPGSVTFRRGEAIETVTARTVVWAAGVKGSSLGSALAMAAGAELDPSGRVKVLADFSLPGHPDVFVIGDLAAYEVTPGRTLPGVAQPALQAGAYVARLILARQRGRTPPAFRYDDRGSMATIGRNAAIAQVGRFRFSGFIACGMWMFIHLLFIEQCHNRLLVLTQWLRSYFTGARSARLIEGASGEGEVLLGSNGDDGAHPSPAPSAPQVASGRSRPVGVTPDTNGGPT